MQQLPDGSAGQTKPHPKVPAYRLHKATGQAVVTLGGRDVYLGKHGTPESQQQYHRAVAEWLAGVQRHREAAGVAVAELVEKHLDWSETYYAKNGRPTSEVVNIAVACRIVVQLYGGMPASEFDVRAAEAVRAAMIAKGWARTTVNRAMGRVVALFKFGTRSKLVPPGVHAEIRTLEPLKRGRCAVREAEPVTPVDDAAVDAIRPFVSRHVWAMVELQRLTGMRSGEVVTLRGADLEIAGDVWTYRPSTHKTEHRGHLRIVHLGPRAQAVLRPFLRGNLAEPLFQPLEAEAERNRERREQRPTRRTAAQARRDAAAARRRRDRPPAAQYTSNSYGRAITRACELAFPAPKDLEGDELMAWRAAHRWHPHQLRHTAATRIRREHGLEAARAILGHRTVAMTSHYAELDGALARRAMASSG